MPYTTLVAGTTITASWANANVRDQTIPSFASASARDSAITVPVQGMIANVTGDTNFTAYTGTAWIEYGRYGAWAAYTPAWSGTLGNGTLNGYYRRLGRDIRYRIKLTWGSTTSHGASNQTLTLPVAPHADFTINHPVGIAQGHQTGTASFQGFPIINSGSTFVIEQSGQGSTFFSNTIPFTWANTHQILLIGDYESAS